MQQVHDVGAADDLLLERHGASLADGFEPVERDHREDVDELPVAVRVLGQAFSRSRVIEAGRFQSLNGAPLRSAPGLRSSAAT